MCAMCAPVRPIDKTPFGILTQPYARVSLFAVDCVSPSESFHKRAQNITPLEAITQQRHRRQFAYNDIAPFGDY